MTPRFLEPVYGRDGEIEGTSIHFVNERGRDIRVAVIKLAEHVKILIQGPDSIHENIVTPVEAAVIRDELIRALTPDATQTREAELERIVRDMLAGKAGARDAARAALNARGGA